MSDNVSKEIRSKTMKAIKSSDTKLEKVVFKELWKKGIRFRKNVKDLFGNPDIAIKKYKIVIFIDSCFWHGCKKHCRIPCSSQEYWCSKIERNKRRDKEVNKYYKVNDWKILRIWEHSINSDFQGTIFKILEFINLEKTRKQKPSGSFQFPQGKHKKTKYSSL